jgi:Arc/MetJ-type ribon-helix-helix transcriptional regulator
MSQESDWRAQFAQMGVNQVRTQVAGNRYSNDLLRAAIKWLHEKDQEADRLSDASQAEQTEIARSAKDAAWAAARAAERAAAAAEKANTRATIALIIATVSIIATAIGIVVVHYDSARSLVP